MASANVQTFSDADFASDVLESQKPVLVDFWAAWCGPCKMIAPVIDALADQYKDNVLVGKLNVDENRATATEYGVMSIPTILIFKGGQVVERAVGYKTKTDLAKLLDKVL